MTNSVANTPRRGLRMMALATTMLCASLPSQVQAQAIPVPPTREVLDANSVDLFRGEYVIDQLVASIGGSQGLQYRLIKRGEAGFTDNFSAVLQSMSTMFLASFEGRTDRFTKTGSTTWVPTEANGSSLTYNATTQIYTYVSRDGTAVTFDKKKVNQNESGVEGLATSIVRPNGERIDFAFDRASYCLEYGDGGDRCVGGLGFARRLSSARNAYGYIFKQIYDLQTIDGPNDVAAWSTPSEQRLVNRAVDNCDPSGACNMTQSWPGPGNPNHLLNTFVWTGSKVTGVRRPGSNSNDLTIGYDSSNKVASIADHAGATGYGYVDAAGVRTVTVTNALSEATVYTFDIASERLTSIKDPLNNTTSYTYDGSGRPTRITKPEGNYTQFTYDARGNVTQTRHVAKSGSSAADIVTTAAFAASCAVQATCNSPVSTTDPRGNTTNYTWDGVHGGLLTVTAPAPTPGAVRPQKRFTYAAKQAQVKSSSGSIVASGQSITLPIGVSECVSLASCAGTAGEVKTSIVYGAAGVGNNLLPTEISSGNGSGALTATTKVAYDSLGDMIAVDGPLSGTDDTTTAIIDGHRRTIGTIAPDPDGAGPRPRLAQRQTFGANGDLTKTEVGTVGGTSSTDLASMTVAQAVDLAYDADGRKVKEALSGSGTVHSVSQSNYDAAGRLTCTAQRMNPAVYASLPTSACTLGSAGSFGPDRITQSIRDISGRVIQVKQGLGTSSEANERTLGYSTNGQLAYLKDAALNRTSYEYDGHDRLVKTRYPVITIGSDSSSFTDYEQLTLDTAGQATLRRLRDGQSINFTFDALGRVTAKDLPGTEPDATYAFDSLNRMTSATQNSLTNSFTWDALSRLTAEAAPQGTVSSQYDLASRRTRITLPGSTTLYADYDLDVTGQVTKIRENGATTGVGVLATYAHDNLGRRTSVTFGNGVSQPYTYDNALRLASLGNDLPGTTNDLAQIFTYSPASQIANVVRTGDVYAWTGHYNQSATSSPNGLNQIGNVGSKNLSHDGRGNITAVGADSYGYSSGNLLTSGPNNTALTYDPMMRLYQMSSGTSVTRMGYDGLDRIAEYDGSNAVLGRYIHGPGIDIPIAWYDGNGTSTRRFLSTDERGSVIAVTDNNGSVLGLNKYDEFGVPQNTNLGKFGYTGQTWAPEVGLWYYKARFYRPDIGRFLQADPIGYEAGTNLYAYVRNDPVNLTDPLGLDPPTTPVLEPGLTMCGSGCVETSPGVAVVTGERRDRGLEDFQNMTAMGQAFLLMGRAYNYVDISRLVNSNRICQIGNGIADVSDSVADASIAVTGTGLTIAAVGVLTVQPEVVAGGVAVTDVGAVFGFASGALQAISGLFQGAATGDFGNTGRAVVSMGLGAVASRGLRASTPPGWHGHTRMRAERNNQTAGNVIGASVGVVERLGVKKVACGR